MAERLQQLDFVPAELRHMIGQWEGLALKGGNLDSLAVQAHDAEDRHVQPDVEGDKELRQRRAQGSLPGMLCSPGVTCKPTAA